MKKIKRIMAAMLAIIMLVAMQPIKATAGQSLPDFIEVVVDTNIADVLVADYEDYINFNDAFDYFEHAGNGAVSAYCETDDTYATVFEEGKEYTLTINVTGAEGYEVGASSTVECTINSSIVANYTAKEITIDSVDYYYFTITYEFAIPEKIMVNNVEVEISLDLDGVSADDYTSFMSLASANVEFGSMPGDKPVYFFDKNDDVVSVLSYSKEYSVYISLKPREGFKFPEAGSQIPCTINGTSVNGTVSDNGLLEIEFKGFKTLKSIVFADFEYTNYKKGLETTEISVTTQKQGITVEHAFLANIDGVVIADGYIGEGMDYLLLVYFTAEDGYIISELQEEGITVEGNEIKEYSYDSGSKRGVFSYELPILEHEHSGGTATCTEKAKCTECFTHDEYGDLDLDNHVGGTEIKNKKAATCKEKGYTGDVYCLGCTGLITVGADIPKTTEHTGDTEIRNKKEATCMEDGYTGDIYCKCCEEKIKSGEVIKKLEHSYDAGVVTKQPTAKAEGVKTYTCTVCLVTKTEVIPKLPAPPKQEEVKKAPAKGTVLTDKKSKAKYKVTKSALKGGTVAYYKPKNKKVTKVVVPATVTIDGIKYKVTGISANAFKGCGKLKSVTIGTNVASIGKSAFEGCKKLKNITIKTTKLKSSKVGSKAFKNVPKNAVVKVPAKKLKTYKKFIYKKGLNKKATIKKIG